MKSGKTQYLSRLLMTLDACLIAFAFILSISVYSNWMSSPEASFLRHLVLLLPLIGSSVFALAYFGAYRGLNTPSVTSYVLTVIKGLSTGTAGLLVAIFLLDIEYVSRLIIGGFYLTSLVLVIGMRLFLVWWYFKRRKENEYNYQKVLIVGTGARAQRLSHMIRTKSEWGISIVGYLDTDPDSVGDSIEGVPVLGTIQEVHDILRDNVVDEVIVAVPRNMLTSIAGIADACDQEGIELRIMADLFDLKASSVTFDLFSGVPMLSFAPVAFDSGKLLLKRLFDIVAVMFALPMLVPIMLLVALAIKLDSDGPVFFVQQRVGLRKRKFRMFKFRTMYVGSDEKQAELAHLNEAEGPIFKMENDPRVTRVGGFLRRTSLDEIPQLINVFFGSMSLVGPRPMSGTDVDKFDKAVQRKRFSVTPGLTWLWQISGRSNLPFEKWLELDLAYIDNWSLDLDLKILVKTIPAVLLQRGAV
jgi:exopolysaccharide biosynthesis polyprenyl glycosylphosphotransferase